MTLLILGLLLWIAAHSYGRVLPVHRKTLDEKGKGSLFVTIAVVISLLMMIFGYRWAEFIHVWSPPSFLTHINNLMMLCAFFLFGMSATTGRLRGKLRHPQLMAVMVWACAHLLVNGDLASIVLFGGMLAWAIGAVLLINRAGPWQRPKPGDAKKDAVLVVITLVTFAITVTIHTALGVSPFGG